MKANARYKDSVFSLLFSNPDLLRELYSALEGVDLPSDVPVTINTLQDVLFMDRVNDISFEIGGRLIVLFEHQSTVNPNLPLRILMYIARLYEKIIDGRNIYTTKLIRIPKPDFYVLYNGNAELPDRAELRLSDMFEETAPLGIPEKEALLELRVKMININCGRNGELAEKCATLAGYSAFIGRVKELEREIRDRAEALRLAIEYCTEHDILKEFLEMHSKEVFGMLMTEWKLDDALAVRYEEGWEGGLERGLETTARNALAQGLPMETVQKITGLDMETLAKLQAGV